MTQDFTDDVLAYVQRERDELQDQVSKLESDLIRVRASHWELVQELVQANRQIEDMTDEIRMMERQIGRRSR